MRIRPVETSGLPIPFQRRGQGPVIVGSPDPLAWANKADGAKHAWDFIANAARWNGQYIGALANTPNWTFTRASTGYAQTSGGVLQSFASGGLRRTDKGVLIEGARTNLCLYSTLEGGTNFPTGWSSQIHTGSSRGPVASTTGAPGAWEATATTGEREFFAQTISVSANSTYTVSLYVEAITGTCRTLSYATNLPAGATSGLITNPSTPGLYSYQVVTAGTAGTISIRTGIDTSGDLTANACTVRWSRVQVELGSFPSSYIPTTTASATRAADSLSITGVTGLEYPLSLYAEFERAVDTGTQETQVYVYSTDSTERALIHRSSGGFLSVLVTDGGVTQASLSAATTPAVGAVARVAGRVALNDVNVAGGGVLATADTSCTMPAPVTTIRFGSTDAGAFYSFGYLRRAALFSRALSDAELQAMTT